MVTEKLNHGFDTLLQAIKAMEATGYRTGFYMKAYGLEDPKTKKTYAVEDIKNIEYMRIDAPLSDPDEESVLYLIETTDENKGWISDSFGIYSDSNLINLISEVEKYNVSNQ